MRPHAILVAGTLEVAMLSSKPTPSPFTLPRRHYVRDAIMVTACLSIIGGFVAQASMTPSAPAASLAGAPLLAERTPSRERLGRRGAQDLGAFATGTPALYPPCATATVAR
ncbi:hypothetical protein AMPC_35850 [Anaeromyxobacter paludicola]|uniref:Uncharacterized protein n=2 Tax=Anaeromyxobacter paludicola TaxID=2918171 RepID=A0ABM7XF63_9BACT|nr:hypothetical protein AMPC_35850 [Anaeromyxobacter paludicola]